MITREDIKTFLIGQKDKTKEEVISNLGSWLSVNGMNTYQISKVFSDIKSYPEWIWGD